MLFDHFNIYVSEQKIEQVKQFYIDVFGLTCGKRPQMQRNGYWMYHQQHAILHINQLADFDPPRQAEPAVLDHVAFVMDGFDSFMQTLKQHNIESDVRHYPDRASQVFIHDPAGTKLEIQFKK